MAKTLPLDAKNIAEESGISFFRAKTNADSEEKGKIVAARNAVIKRATSCIEGVINSLECFEPQRL